MRTVEIGHTGLRASEVGFGGIPIQRLSHEEAVAVVRGCLDLGITLIDTAMAYTTSEERIGEAIRGRREGLVLCSKTPANDGAGARAHLEASLRRLGVEHIDIYQLHGVSDEARWQAVTAPGGALEALQKAQREGLIGQVGVTSHQLDVANKAVRSGAFATVMFPLNFVAYEPGLELLKTCRELGVGFFAMKPMGGGLLAHAEAAFQYLRQHADAIPVVGIERVAEMQQIVELYAQPATLSPALQAEIARIRTELGTVFCRRCDYCQPCAAGIRISTVMNVPAMMGRMPDAQVAGSDSLNAQVEAVADCQDCGECESRCPYKLSIRERLREVLAMYREARKAFLAR